MNQGLITKDRILILVLLLLQAECESILSSGGTEVYYELIKISSDNDAIQFTMVTPNQGYMGIGYNTLSVLYMNSADMTICSYVSGACSCKDYFSTSNQQSPTLDSHQDVTTLAALCSRSASIFQNYNQSFQGGTRYKFIRKLDTLDAPNDSVIALSSSMNFIWAIGSSDSLIQHQAFGTLSATLKPQTTIFTSGSDVKIQYSMLDSTTIQFIADISAQGYFGLGYNTQTMATSNLTICLIQNSLPVCNDYTSDQHNTPTIDATQNTNIIVPQSYSSNNGRHFVFTRTLNTGDSIDAILSLDTSSNFIWAMGSTDSLVQHATMGTFSATLSFSQTQPPTNTDPTPTSAFKEDDMDSTLKINSNLAIKWKFNTDATIEFVVDFSNNQWIGIGFGVSMSDTDMVVAQINNNAIIVKDYWSTGHSTPGLDNQQDITLVSSLIGANNIKFRLKRKLDTGDSQDKVLVQDQSYEFCFASNSGNSMREHNLNEAGAFKIQLSKNIDKQAELIVLEKSPLVFAHGILLFIAWGLVADIGIIFARFLKSSNHYINFHAFSFVFVDLTTIIMVIIQLTNTESEGELLDVHGIMGIILIVIIFFQHVGGVAIKLMLEERSKNNKEMALTIKFGHQVLGTFLFIFAKVEIGIGLWINDSRILFVLGIIWMIVLIIIRIVLEILKARSSNVTNFKQVNPILNLSENQIYLMKLLNSGASTEEILKTIPTIKWVLLNDDVYDLTNYQHPGGNFIIEQCVGREVGRFFFGAYGLETTKLKPHVHSQTAVDLLKDYNIGRIQAPSLLVPLSKIKYQKKQTKVPVESKKWTKIQQTLISKSIYKFEFMNSGYKVKNFVKGVEYFGKHFTLSKAEFGNNFHLYIQQGEKTRMYTTVVSLSQANELQRNQQLNIYDKIDGAAEGQNNESKYEELSDLLTFIIKIYRGNDTFSQYLLESSQMEYVVKGPFGRGLELVQNSTGTYIIFAGGTGILPFMDLLDFVLKKTIHSVVKSKGMNVFPNKILRPRIGKNN